MVAIIYAAEMGESVAANLGRPEYSYYFVFKAFRAVLRRLAYVVETADPEKEVDALYERCKAMGEPCVFVSFAPPHKAPTGLRCPTISVIAWEFTTIPTDPFLGDRRNDWRNTLRRHAGAIMLSRVAARAVGIAMGSGFPVWAIPAPVWDDYVTLYESATIRTHSNGVDLVFAGRAIDFHRCDAPWVAPAQHARFIEERSLPKCDEPIRIRIEGIIYTTVFNPLDGRKNWPDLVSAFVWAFKNAGDVTLVFKVIHGDFEKVRELVTDAVFKLMPFKCRVVVLHGYLNDTEYAKLIRESTYVVNTSSAEGQCLPLAEFMSAGKPAISPAHTAMEEYIDADNSFVVRSSAEAAWWQHDIRQAFRTRRYRVDWESLRDAYLESYRVATSDPARYARMARRAVESLRGYCSQARVEARLASVLRERATAIHEPQSTGRKLWCMVARPIWKFWTFVAAPELQSVMSAARSRGVRSSPDAKN